MFHAQDAAAAAGEQPPQHPPPASEQLIIGSDIEEAIQASLSQLQEPAATNKNTDGGNNNNSAGGSRRALPANVDIRVDLCHNFGDGLLESPHNTKGGAHGAISPSPADASPGGGGSSGYGSRLLNVAPTHDSLSNTPTNDDDGGAQQGAAHHHHHHASSDDNEAKAEDANTATEDPENRRKSNLYVCMLASDVTDTDVRSLFSKFGTIESAKVMLNIHTGVSRGIAFVKFTTAQAAATAIAELNGTVFHGRAITVRVANAEAQYNPGPPTNKIFVRNVPCDIGKLELYETFSKFGEVTDVAIHSDTAITKFAGMYAPTPTNIVYITFDTKEAAKKAAETVHNTTPFPSCHRVPLLAKVAEDSAKRIERIAKRNQQRRGGGGGGIESSGGTGSATATPKHADHPHHAPPLISPTNGARPLAHVPVAPPQPQPLPHHHIVQHHPPPHLPATATVPQHIFASPDALAAWANSFVAAPPQAPAPAALFPTPPAMRMPPQPQQFAKQPAQPVFVVLPPAPYGGGHPQQQQQQFVYAAAPQGANPYFAANPYAAPPLPQPQSSPHHPHHHHQAQQQQAPQPFMPQFVFSHVPPGQMPPGFHMPYA